MTSKDTLRREAIRHRDRIDPASEDVDNVATLFFDNIKPKPDQVIALYWAKGREFDPSGLLEKLLDAGHRCALPVIRTEDKILHFALWDEGKELGAGPHGILQPVETPDTQWVEPDIVVLPLLIFDRRGNRLGYGGGYYDATLARLRHEKDVIAVGVCYAQQAALFSLPVEPHDQRLDWVITPREAHCFREQD